MPINRRWRVRAAKLLVCFTGSSGVAEARVEAPTYASHVAEASQRFGVPERWIRAVIRVESAGKVTAVSRAGAIGLMQVMPATYAELARRHGLGPNPFDSRDNVLAGTAYLRELHDRYGQNGAWAAYNAGPGRWEDHLRRGRPLPAETVAYVSRLRPLLGRTPTRWPAPVSRADWAKAGLFVEQPAVGGRSVPAQSAGIEGGLMEVAPEAAETSVTHPLFAIVRR